MFYHRQAENVVINFKAGMISRDTAFEKLRNIENEAYEKIPNAEPDGDIAFCIAYALEEIENFPPKLSQEES